jgi:pimeloyl-ACP methyl ester carboxylesterase
MKTRKNKKPRLTGNPVRELSFLAWKNNSANLETMRSPLWKRTLARERTFWNALVQKAQIKQLQKDFEEELRETVKPMQFRLLIGCGNIEISYGTGDAFYWRWYWSKQWHYASELDFYENKAYYITEDKKDAYVSNLICQSIEGHNLWTKRGISGQVAVKDGLCYYVNVEYPFNTTELVCCDALTGKNDRVILKEPDEERFISLIKASGKALYCKTGTWNGSRCWRIQGATKTEIYKGTQYQNPYGIFDGHECGYYKKKGAKGHRYGAPYRAWIMPPGARQWTNLQSGHVITMNEGTSTLFLCGPHKRPVKIHSIRAGDFNANPWAKWENTPVQYFTIFTPEELPYTLLVPNNSATVKRLEQPKPKIPFDDLKSTLYHAISLDGTKVPYLLVKSEKTHRVQGLVCYIYGAYGSGTNVSWPYQQWAPLLNRGFAIVYCYARGGGDNGFKWMDAGQDIEHHKTVEDFEATIRSAQKVTGIAPRQTILYGRSAGGMMVGATTMRNPDGSLHGALFTEMPFTDILRTQTNPTIDLTPSGMSEYGNPITNPVAFEALLRLSPVNSMPVDGAPGVFVLCRTGLRDQQVLPFEPVKFIQKLRGTNVARDDPNGKFLDYEKKEEHSYSPAIFRRERATDLALLFRWSQNKI